MFPLYVSRVYERVRLLLESYRTDLHKFGLGENKRFFTIFWVLVGIQSDRWRTE